MAVLAVPLDCPSLEVHRALTTAAHIGLIHGDYLDELPQQILVLLHSLA